MDIILLEQIAGLGKMGETTSVKAGFARNYLIPQGKALPATAANTAKFEATRNELEAKNKAEKEAAQAAAEKLEGTSVTLSRQASEIGQLYGSVKARDIVNALAEKSVEIERSQIMIADAIKDLGDYEVKVRLHPEVFFKLPVVVERLSN